MIYYNKLYSDQKIIKEVGKMVIAVCFVIIVVCVLLLVIGTGPARKAKKVINSFKKRPGVMDCAVLRHAYGLDFADDAECIVCLCNTGFVFARQEKEIFLSFAKVADVSLKTDLEIQRSYTSSAGGAVAGALLLGPLGAAVGGRTKQKVNRSVKYYLIFTYNKDDGSTGFISFKTPSVGFANRCINVFNSIPRERQIINL